jgi:hypothetical protein
MRGWLRTMTLCKSLCFGSTGETKSAGEGEGAGDEECRSDGAGYAALLQAPKVYFARGCSA